MTYGTEERKDKMTIDELLKAKDKNEQIIADYLRKYSENNHWSQIEATQRPLSECMSKIKELARKKAVGGCACVADTEVFQWAIDFYNGVEPRVEPLVTEPVKAEKPKPKKTVEKKVENDEQMSLFDFL